MKIFIQTASLDAIRQAAETGLADGVALSPVDLAADDPTVDITDHIAEMGRVVAIPILVSVTAIAANDMYRQGRELARASDHVIVQMPFLEDAIVPIRKLVADGIRICATHVYSGAQAFLAAKIGARMVSVNLGDLDAHGQRSGQVVAEIRDVIDHSDLECDLTVGLPCSSYQFTECLLAGADTMCIAPDQLQQLLVHSLTDRSVDRFLRDLSRRRKPRSI